MSTLRTMVEALRDQLRTNINGTTGYNNRLKDEQVVRGYVSAQKANIFPTVCIVSASEEDLPADIPQSKFERLVGIELLGYVKTKDDRFDEAMKLQSDIRKAIEADSTIGDRLYGLEASFGVGSEDLYGVVYVRITAKYRSG